MELTVSRSDSGLGNGLQYFGNLYIFFALFNYSIGRDRLRFLLDTSQVHRAPLRAVFISEMQLLIN